MSTHKTLDLIMICLVICICSSNVWANTKIEPAVQTKVLSHKQWREQQLNQGQNLIVRLTNRIAIVKETTGNLDTLRRLEAELRIAAQNLDLLKGLTIEDYLNFYLLPLSEEQVVVTNIAKKMSQREVAIMLQLLLEKMRESVVSIEPSPALVNLAGQQQRLIRAAQQGLD